MLSGIPLGFEFGVVTPTSNDPAAGLADLHVPGEITGFEAITALAAWADVVTVEIEHVNLDALDQIEASGTPVHPGAEVLRTINDKLRQKQVLAAAGLPVPRLWEQPPHYPIMEKSRFGGYDGRGVQLLSSAAQKRLSGSCFYEELVEIDRELAVLVWRNVNGEQGTYPVVEMEFDNRAHICNRVLFPARVARKVAAAAADLALAAAAAVETTGIVAVELFLSRGGDLLVNELAPRPHNSGHLTIEAFETSQYEQHLRAITGLSSGSVRALSPAVMQNLLGHPDADQSAGPPDLSRLFAATGAHLHWYGKSAVKPFRKMGHLTVTAESLEEAISRLDRLHEDVWIGRPVMGERE